VKILQLSSAQAFGGGERHLVDLAEGLVRSGHEVHTALRPRASLIKELSDLPGIQLTTLPLRNALDALSARQLGRYVRQHSIQIVHAHLARDYPLAAYAARRNPHCKMIVTRHVLFPLNPLHALTLSRCSRIIAVSKAVQRALSAQYLLPAERIVVIPNGIDISKYEPQSDGSSRVDLRLSWRIPEDALLIGSVGEITALKGHEDFLRSAALVLRSFPKSKFIIAGVDATPGGPNLAKLKRQIAQLGLGDNVRVLGWVEDLPALYNAIDVFVSASHTESFGLTIAEAMAARKPVVATATEGAWEVIGKNESGVLVPLGNVEALASAVVDLIGSSDKRERLGEAAHERVREKFSLDRMIGETEKLYEQVLLE